MTLPLPARPTRDEPHTSTAVNLLDVEPLFVAAVPDGDMPYARRVLRTRRLEVPTGEWTPSVAIAGALALLVLDGLVLRERPATQGAPVALVGTGDIVDVRNLADGAERWRVLRPASFAVVDARLLVAGRRWPRLFSAVTQRAFDAVEEQAALNAILCLPRVEQRLLALLAHYAERWGRMTPSGIVLDLPVTHEMLGRLVGSKRPTVSLALSSLLEEGRLARDGAGRWVLPALAAVSA